MQLVTDISLPCSGMIRWVIRDERYRLGCCCSNSHTHVGGVVRYPVDATQADLNGADAAARRHAANVVQNLIHKGYADIPADVHLGGCSLSGPI